jgi:superoxide dismutase
MKYFLSFLLVSLLLLSACGPEEEEQSCAFIPETSEIEVEITLTSLSDSLANVSSKEALVKLLGDHKVLREIFFKRSQYPNDSVFINELYRRFTNIHLDTLAMEVKRVFGNEQKLKAEFTEALKT